jgi:secreted PhoX family phosphatase
VKKTLAALSLAALSLAPPALAGPDPEKDFGRFVEHQLAARAEQLFGFARPLPHSSTASVSAAEAEADPLALVTLARGLRARVVSAAPNLGPNADMMALWPDDRNPTHLITCNEQGAANPGVQRVRLSDGAVETILTGTVSCDPIRRTPWGTILAGEEAGASGRLLEIIDPLGTTGVSFDRIAGTTSGGTGAANVAVRDAVGRLSFEGIGLYPSGLMYYGDENRPSRGTAGGAYFKFVPATPWTGGAAIRELSESPLAAGRVFGLRLGVRSGATDYGQGTSTGLGTWVEVAAGDLRAAAATLKLTGYYRPEDIDVDATALAEGRVRFCAANTGNEGDDRLFGEVICVTDGTTGEALVNGALPEVQLFVAGTPELAMMDNVAYQPGRGSWILHEDGDGVDVGRNNDLWACLADGEDADTLSDGCVRFATLNDLGAEWTGGFFDETGRTFYVSVQHNATGHGVILAITGWR